MLNTVTDIVDPSYSAVVTACDAREAVVVERQNTTQAEDEAAIAEIRTQCDLVFSGFETVRQAQLAASRAIDAAIEDGDRMDAAREAVAALGSAWTSLQPLLTELRGEQ